ncbi:MAG: class A beta-lactamase [Bacteroidales bacterium]|jgi:beta-lactamase class A/lipopolysaccharide export system protein LptA|nr:class A beta-lactamase [Bacteroidales bacterium]
MSASVFRKAGEWLLFMLFSTVPLQVHAQDNVQIKKIEITNYGSMEFSRYIAPDAQRLLGDVGFLHEGITMTCDSAYFYNNTNTLDAFGHVHILHPDSSTVDGDFAKYRGDFKFAEIWDNVVLQDSDAIMKTPHLYYDMTTNIAYYSDSAHILNKGNEMSSKTGYYHRDINTFYFKKEVVLHTPDYTIVTDTLNYNVQTKIADFVGPTHIQNDKDTIYCELGWYNTNDTVALFRKNAWIKSGSTTVNSDTLYYERVSGNGHAFGNIQITDTTNNIILKGQKGEFNNISENAWLTRRAEMIMTGKEDSLFLHSDTLRSIKDTADFKIVKAYKKVKFFSRDMQGMCDSLVTSLRDSIIRMYTLPVLWTQGHQMTADYIEIETERQQPKQLNLLGKGFIASQEDSVGFNQIRGKKIVGLFRNGNELYRINVYDNGESVYYTKDGDFVNGANKISSTNIVILIEEKKVKAINHYINIEGAIIPPIEFNSSELTLSGFNWWEKHRPLDPNDIFHWGERNIIAGNDSTGLSGTASDQTPDSLRRHIRMLINGKQARVGVALTDSRTGDTLTINGNEYFPTASVYKYHVALAILRLVDFGTLRLNQKIRVAKEDLHPNTHSPMRDDYPKGDIDLTLSELMSYMVSKSDNNACDILLKLLKGPQRTEQIVKSMGLSDISIVAYEHETAADSANTVYNKTTPLSALRALEIQRRQDVLSAGSRNFLWKLMTETVTGQDKIKGKLPPSVVTGHKTGSSHRNAAGTKLADNDIGIVELSEKQHFIIAVFIADSQEDDKTNAALIADITQLAWKFYREYPPEK